MRLHSMVTAIRGLFGHDGQGSHDGQGGQSTGCEGSSTGRTGLAAPPARVCPMDVAVHEEADGRFVISCPDQLSWQARVDLVDAVRRVADGRPVAAVILDLDRVGFINSAGLGAIFTLRKYAQQAGAQMIIARAGSTIQRLFRTVNLPALIPVAGSLEEARARLAGTH